MKKNKETSSNDIDLYDKAFIVLLLSICAVSIILL